MAIIDKIYEDTWIENHSVPCVSDHLQKTTVNTIIYPQIEILQKNNMNDDEFIIQISETLREHQDVTDIAKIIECIIQKMIPIFEANHSKMPPPFLSIAAFTVLGKCIFLLGKKAGYIR